MIIPYDNPPEPWAWQHFYSTGLEDARLKGRAVQIATAMADKPGGSFSQRLGEEKDIKAAYRFFSNPNVTPGKIQSGHFATVKQAMEQEPTCLLIEDTSEFSWSGKEKINGLGGVGSGLGKSQGFHLQNVLAVKWPESFLPGQNKRPPLKVLGLAHQEYYIRKPKSKKKESSYQKSARPRESQLWTRSSFSLGHAPKGVRWIRICDRGADIYEMMQSCRKYGHDFVIRASKDRCLIDPNTGKKYSTHLFEKVRQNPTTLGTMELDLRSRKDMTARKAELAISAQQVHLAPPRRKGVPAGSLPPTSCSVVWVREINAPEGVESLEWFLLCGSDVVDYTQAITCVLQYSSRWMIEEYHKAIKTGLGGERLQMKEAQHLFAAIAIMSIVALRLLDLREAYRFWGDKPAEKTGLTDLELKILRLKTKRPCRTTQDVAMAIGKLGGHIGRKGDGQPGWLTLYRGMNELRLLVAGALLITGGENS